MWHAVRKAVGKEPQVQAAIKAYRIQQDDESDGRYLYNEVLRQLCVFVRPPTPSGCSGGLRHSSTPCSRPCAVQV